MYASTSTPVSAHSNASSQPSSPSSAPSTHHHHSSAPVNCNAPQCCHCGWRGAHAPTCPFK
ncbi:hypothetical protein K474DRAFT_1655700 [Panus rudis PR-1116 ss-1]|nr:hypothetical protein K474DRAFT_1655700 [Panus rudis PR-1116 ss-1]